MFGSMFNLWKPFQKFGGLTPKKIWGQKNAEFGPVSDPFPIWARIFPERMEISKIWKPGAWQRSFPRSTKKLYELWSTNRRDLEVELYPKNWLLWKNIFRPIGGAAPWNLYTHHRMAKSCQPTPHRGWGFPNNFFQWWVKSWLKT